MLDFGGFSTSEALAVILLAELSKAFMCQLVGLDLGLEGLLGFRV